MLFIPISVTWTTEYLFLWQMVTSLCICGTTVSNIHISYSVLINCEYHLKAVISGLCLWLVILIYWVHFCVASKTHIPHFLARKTHRPIRRTVIFSLEILEKNNDECVLILVIYWKKTGLLHTKISNHNII